MNIRYDQATPAIIREYFARRNGETVETPIFDMEALRYDCRLINDACNGYVDLSEGLAVVTGTGWLDIKFPGEVIAEIPYEQFTSFSSSSVSGHPGKLVVHRSENADIFEWQGRNHAYQQASLSKLTPLIAIPFISSAFDCPTIVLTQGVGAIGIEPKTYLVVADHIGTENLNLHPGSHLKELFGDEEFTKCGKIYDPQLRKLALDAFQKENIAATEGVYRFWLSKHFQTGAEIDLERKKVVSFYNVDGGMEYGQPAVIGKSNVIDAIYSVGLAKPMRVLSICLATNEAQPLVDPTAIESIKDIEGPDHGKHLFLGRQMAETSARVMKRIINEILALNATNNFD